MNPFDLSGPSFLVFYIGVALVVIIGLKLVIDEAEGGTPRALPLNDPYQIAWLRGGTPEAARIAVLSLTDRGLLAVSGNNLVNLSIAQCSVREPIERAILTRCAQSGTPATAILKDPAVERACAPYQARLERLQLVPDAAMRAQRYRWLTVAIAILLGIALGKIVIAFGRGKYNVQFLVILMALGSWVVLRLVRRRRTHLGSRMLNDLRRLFKALRQRAASIRPGAMTSDAMLLAAVFGISALPATGFADFLRVYKKAARSRGDCGSGCGTACGSGCGGGGGGGCGGCGSS
ncbi:MAG: TIGR04222 domain-containing membrane protein [Alphaproteobacteria bacterium]|nr:TIGR04222 domain-containing membrane protein [Alphaproteobacteria bacterium]